MEREEIKHASWNLCSRPGTGDVPLVEWGGRGEGSMNSGEQDLLFTGSRPEIMIWHEIK